MTWFYIKIVLHIDGEYGGQFANDNQKCYSIFLHNIPNTTLWLLLRSMENAACSSNVTHVEPCPCIPQASGRVMTTQFLL